jgi:hypothetical protein
MTQIDCYLIFTRTQIIDLRKTAGFSLKPNERALRVVLEVEEGVFDEPPVPTVRLTVGRSEVMRVIEPEILSLPEPSPTPRETLAHHRLDP